MQEAILIVFYVVILLYSVILHEVFHGIMALWLGDPTAKYAGRLTANPLKHIDPWFTIMVPALMLILTQGRFAFGGAKPVPYNPYNLKNQKWGPAVVAFAGPLSNISIALIAALVAKSISIPLLLKERTIEDFGVIISNSNLGFIERFHPFAVDIANSFGSIFFGLMLFVIFWNVLLAFFNLIPIPPLDGSKLLFAILPLKIETMAILEQFGFILLLFVIILFSAPLGYFLGFMLNLFLGITI